ncbi:T9SS type A sorting domain-containing protein [Chryseobacterium tongliaoense]|uniref:T9SS type A sorting domain-containing protein n=1 Tax=Chryseobacterium tongliaoense TaxID=3240933 RepID=UPI00351283FF
MRKIIYFLTVVLVPNLILAQLQNLNFEQWDNLIDVNAGGFDNRPTGWIRSNSTAIHPSQMFNFPPTADAHSGNYALKLGVWYTNDKDAAIQTANINYRPTALKGYYKYEHNIIHSQNGAIVNDIAVVTILLTKNVNNQTITIGSGTINLSGTNSYTEFTVPVTYLSNDIPNNVTITLDPSLVRRDPNVEYIYQAGDGTTSYFTVDNLSLTTTSLGVHENELKNSIVVYPNPVDDYIHIANYKGSISIYDITGKLVQSNKEVVDGVVAIAFLVPGPYILKLNDGIKNQTVKFVKK